MRHATQAAASPSIAGFVVSNHGGRNLDGAIATAESLPRCAAAAREALALNPGASCVGACARSPAHPSLAFSGRHCLISLCSTMSYIIDASSAPSPAPLVLRSCRLWHLLNGRTNEATFLAVWRQCSSTVVCGVASILSVLVRSGLTRRFSGAPCTGALPSVVQRAWARCDHSEWAPNASPMAPQSDSR
eukprot:SAG11_NODE_1689_length_4443_cov_7.468002_4_plen_189_part_00